MNRPRFVGLFLSLIFLTACQTLSYKAGTLMPANLDSQFHSCASIDGSAKVETRTAGPALTVDWISDEECKLRAIAQNPLGQKVVEFNVDSKSLASSKPAVSQLLSLDASGFILYDGYFTGLHRRELASFMGFYLPVAWRDLPANVSSDGKVVRLLDEKRKILIDHQLGAIKTEISWASFLGLSKRTLKLTLTKTLPKALTLEFNGQELGTWTDADRDNF